MADLLASGVWSDSDTWNDAATWADSGGSAGPATGTITGIPDARMVTPLLAPPRTSAASAPSSAYAIVYSAMMSPGTKADWGINLLTELNGDAIATIVSVTADAAAAAVGVSIDTGGRRPMMDVPNGLLRFCASCTPVSGMSYATPIPVAFKFVVLTTGGADNLPRTYEFTVVIMVVQL